MSTGNWLTLISIAVAAVVALAIAYMHRKQMRQIELRRVDPTLPVHPPPHAVTRFIKNYGIYFWCLGWGAYSVFLLVRDLRKTEPVTREVIVSIVMDITGVILMMTLASSVWFSNRTLDVTFGIFKDSIKTAREVAVEMADILKTITERMKSLDARITKLEEARTVTPASEPSDSGPPSLKRP
jgi:hypothetical protein